MVRPDLALELLIFRAGETRFGLDAAQIAEVVSLDEVEIARDGGDGGPRVRRGGAEVPVVGLGSMEWERARAQSRSAKLVLPKSTPPAAGFVIGDPDEMVRVEADRIEPLPPLIRDMVRGSGMWAAARCEGGLVILIDLAEAAQGAFRR